VKTEPTTRLPGGLRWAALLAVLVCAVAAGAAARPGDNPCEGLEPQRCDELTALLDRVSAEVADPSSWTEMPPRQDPEQVFIEATGRAELIDAAAWPEGFAVGDVVLRRLHETLEGEIDEINRLWDDTYFELLRTYNIGLEHAHGLEALEAEREAILTSLGQKSRRIAALEDLYLQNLRGIPTGLVVMGSGTWDGRQSITEFRKSIERRMGELAAEAGPASLVTASLKVVSNGLASEVIVQQSGGLVEAFESDPYCVARRREHYCVQMFRVFPEFTFSPVTGEAQPTWSGNAGRDDGVEAELIRSLNDRAVLKGRLDAEPAAARISEMLQRIEGFNRVKMQDLVDLETKFEREISQTREARAELHAQFERNRGRLEVAAASASGDLLGGATIEPRAALDEVYSWLHRRSRAIDDFLSRRDYVAVTSAREYLHGSQTTDELVRILVADAVKRLDHRRHQFLSRRVIRVVGGVLESVQGEQYYQEGQLRSFALPAFILSYPERADGEERGTQVQASILLAVLMRFDKRGENHQAAVSPVAAPVSAPVSVPVTPSPLPSHECDLRCQCDPAQPGSERFVRCRESGLVHDRDRDLVWAVGDVRTRSGASSAVRFAAGFRGLGSRGWRLPTARELMSLSPSEARSLGLPAVELWSGDSHGKGFAATKTVVSIHDGSSRELATRRRAAVLLVLQHFHPD